MRKVTPKSVLLFILATVLAALLLAAGMRSATRQDGLFLAFRQLKQWVLPPQDDPRHIARRNEHGQLIAYRGKQGLPPPEITDRTMVAFVFGQSNSANYGGERHAATPGKVYNHFDGRFYLAADPLLGADGEMGSVWTNLADKIVQAGLADKVILLAAGVGNTSVQAWRVGGPLHGMLAERLAGARRQHLKVTHFLWHQGEADHDMAPEVYEAGLNEVIALTRRYFPDAAFHVAQASRCGIAQHAPRLVAAQRRITRQQGVFLGPDTDAIGLADRYDGCHFSGRGLERHAQGWLQALTHPRQAP